ncbi:MAG: sulfatase-like hydrolase/transferase [Acidobacteria bacterium]|nr:sulfatase-like hydrolase/transferase [Acidobacteriota bacterium]MCB9396992.1 sulfatase-like hydrolase/transferase [Acidobacteriota bacterium]
MVLRVMVLLVVLLSWSCQRSKVPAQTPIFLISVDTLRSDHLPAYGYAHIQTPNLSQFANSADLYENAFSPAPLTFPAHSSLMTGMYPWTHQVRDNLGFSLSENLPTLASILKGTGYFTAAAVSSVALRAGSGIERGFSSFEGIRIFQEAEGIKTFGQRPGAETLSQAKQQLKLAQDQPIFHFLHLYEPHSPYNAGPPYDQQTSNPYDAEILKTDALLGEWFEALMKAGLYDRALIILVSDHGEGLGDHGEREHGLLLYRESLQVPMMIKWPGQKKPKRIAEPASLVDIAPTVLNALNLEFSADGLPLNQKIPKRALLAESQYGALHYGWAVQACALDTQFHWIKGVTSELYDWQRDAAENQPLPSNQIPGYFQDLLSFHEQATPQSVSGADRALLESLGYAGSFHSGESRLQLPPQKFVALVQRFLDISARWQSDPSAKADCDNLMAEFPQFTDAFVLAASKARELRDSSQVKHILEPILMENPGDSRVVGMLAEAYWLLGDREKATALIPLAKNHDPQGFARYLLPHLAQINHPDAAYFSEILMNQQEPMGFHYASLDLLQKRRFQEALNLLDRGIEIAKNQSGPDYPATLYALRGRCLWELGSAEAAREALQMALNLGPHSRFIQFQWLEIGLDLKWPDLWEKMAGWDWSQADTPYQTLWLRSLIRLNQGKSANQFWQKRTVEEKQASLAPWLECQSIPLLEGLNEDSEPLQSFMKAHLARLHHQSDQALLLRAEGFEHPSFQQFPGPTQVELLFQQGDDFARNGQMSDAARALIGVLAQDPLHTEANVALANLYAQAGRPTDASRILTHWAELKPSPRCILKAESYLKALGQPDLAKFAQN